MKLFALSAFTVLLATSVHAQNVSSSFHAIRDT
jgi:hypothetical protein